MNNSTKQPPVKESQHEQTRCPAREFTTASHLAHPSLTTSTTNISRTREKSSRASTHLRIDTSYHHTRACCVAQATRIAWRGNGPSTLTAPTASHRGCPEWACGTDTTLVQSPEHGPGVRCKPYRAGCANETASGPRSLAGRGRDPIGEHDLGGSASLQVVIPTFARGL